jgi:hypothetical protein
MSNAYNLAVLPSLQVTAPTAELDLGISAISTSVVRAPYAAGALDYRATRTILSAAVTRAPYAAGSANLRATRTVLTVG